MSYKLFTTFMLPIFISCVSWYFIIIIIIGWFYWIIMSAHQFHQIKFKQLLAFPDCFHSSVLFLLVLVPSVTQKLLCFRFLIRHCWAVGSQPAWSPNSDSRTVHVGPWCLLKAGEYQLSMDQRLGQFCYSIIKFCVYFRWHLKICSSPACNPFLVGSIRGPPGTPIHPFTHFYMGNIYNLLCIVSQTRRWNHTHAKTTLAHICLNHGPLGKPTLHECNLLKETMKLRKNVS